MLTIAKIKDVEYYLDCVADSLDTYYAGDGEPPGRWLGKGAAAIGLAGEVGADRLRALFAGDLAPDGTKYPLKVPGYDLTFAAPKSVSLLWAFGRKEVADAVGRAHDEAVETALALLEREACFVRRGHGGQRLEQGAGFIAADYRHRIIRSGDPHLHTHLLVSAYVADATGRYTALDGTQLYSWSKVAGMVYQATLRTRMMALGFDWELSAKGYGEIVGVHPALLKRFSSRHQEIEVEADRRGVISVGGLARLQRATRKPKDREQAGSGDDVLRERWRQELAALLVPLGRRGFRQATAQDVTGALGKGPALAGEVAGELDRVIALVFAADQGQHWQESLEQTFPLVAELRRASTFLRADLYRVLLGSVRFASLADIDAAVERALRRSDCIDLSSSAFHELGGGGVAALESPSFVWSGEAARSVGLVGYVGAGDFEKLGGTEAWRIDLRPVGEVAEAWREGDDRMRAELAAACDAAVEDAIAEARGLAVARSVRRYDRAARLDVTLLVAGLGAEADPQVVEAFRRAWRDAFAVAVAERGLSLKIQARTGTCAMPVEQAVVLAQGGEQIIRTKRGRLVAAGPGQRRYATAEILGIERSVVKWALATRGQGIAVVPPEVVAAKVAQVEAAKGIALDGEQRAMVEALAGSGNQVDVVVGVAGSGKSTALVPAARSWEAMGRRVVGCATQGKTARDLGREVGIDSYTVARLIRSPQPLAEGTVVVLDEAGMTSSRDLAALAAKVAACEGKLVMCGDPRQLAPVDTAGLLRSLGLRFQGNGLIQLRVNRRQVERWEQRAVQHLRQRPGQNVSGVAQALEAYLKHGAMHAFGDFDSAAQAMVERWDEARRTGGDRGVLMVAGTNEQREAVNRLARQRRKDAGELGKEIQVDGVDWAVGDQVITTTPDKDRRWVNGEMGVIQAVAGGRRAGVTIVFDEDRRQVRVSADDLRQGHVAHAYCLTAHKAQGQTVDLCLLLGSDAFVRELVYSAMTRGKRNEMYVPLVTLAPRDEGSHQVDEPEPSEEAWRCADRLLEDEAWSGSDRRVLAASVQHLIDCWEVSGEADSSADFRLGAEGLGKLVEANPPDWLVSWLGPPPLDGLRRRAWRSAAGEAVAWRRTWGVLEDGRPGLPPVDDPLAAHARKALLGRIQGDLVELGVHADVLGRGERAMDRQQRLQ